MKRRDDPVVSARLLAAFFAICGAIYWVAPKGPPPRERPMAHCYEYPRPAVAVDLVVFGEDECHRLHALLIRRGKDPHAGRWALPGGFLNLDETGREAAARELREETGLPLEAVPAFLKVCDRVDRDPRGRVLALAYAVLIGSLPEVRGADDAAEARWVPVAQVADLAFDHDETYAVALEWLHATLYPPADRRTR